MGKASSSKKVARAAGIGGSRTAGRRVPWSYYGAIAVIVVAGVGITWTSRDHALAVKSGRTTANAAVAPKVGGTPWNEAYAVDVCGRFQPPIRVTADRTGITTAGDGVIHIAPRIESAAGRNATLGVFADSVGLRLSATEVGLPKGKLYTSGDTCRGKPAEVYVKQYAFAGSTVGTLLRTDPRSVPLVNGALLTIAFVPPADKGSIPPPPQSVQQALSSSTTTTTTPTTVPPSTTTPTTVPAPTTTSRHAATKGRSKGSATTTTTK